MMAGSPVSFNILKGKLMSFLYNIQHAKMFIIIFYADVNDFNVLLRFFHFSRTITIKSRRRPRRGKLCYMQAQFVLVKKSCPVIYEWSNRIVSLILLRLEITVVIMNLNNYTILVFIKPPKSLLLIWIREHPVSVTYYKYCW